MAYSIETLRNDIITSIHGRRLGLDTAGRLIGHEGLRIPEVDATSDTTGTVITGHGWTNVDTSTDDTWLLAPPVKGAFKYIYTGSTSTGIRTILRQDATFAIRSSANSTSVGIIAQGGGLLLELFGLTSAIYAIVSRPTGFSSACSTEMALTATT
jgi:hypothetical protein